MQIKTQTDYAVQILLFLFRKNSFSTTKDISASLGIAETYLVKIIRRLRNMGWVVSSPGARGGYVMAGQASKITLWDVMQVTEDKVVIDRCLEDSRYCRATSAAHTLCTLYSGLQEIFEWYFSTVTIEDLAKPDGVQGYYNKVLSEVRKQKQLQGI